MGLFGSLFKKEKDLSNSELVEEKNSDISKDIEFLLDVLGNLGVLSKDSIRNKLFDSANYNEELLDKLDIFADEDYFSSLGNYYGSYNIGYGSEKIDLLRQKYNEECNKMIKDGLSNEKIEEKLIKLTNEEINKYRELIKFLNEEIISYEEKNNDPTSRLMIEIYIKKLKERELGFPKDLYALVQDMASELVNLDHGGYGEEEVNQFVKDAEKIIEDDAAAGISTTKTLDRINNELFNPKKKRYASDLAALNKKIEMIDASTYISDLEKEQNKEKIVNEFRQMNGHTANVDSTIRHMKSSLADLEYGGYGDIVIDKFVDYCDDVVEKGKEENLEQAEIIKKIQSKYDKLLKDYEIHLSKLKEELEKAKDESVKEDLIEDFNDLMGHKVDYDKRLTKYKEDLENLEYGGYNKEIVYDFINEAHEKIEYISSNDELSNYMKQVRRKYRELMNNYNKELEKLNNEIDKVKSSKKKSEAVIEKEVEILVMSFKSKFGHDIDYEEVVKKNVSELQNLEGGGYGKKVLDNYREYCDGIIANGEDSDAIFKKIQNKYKDLKKNYMDNLKIFKEWKRLQLKNKSGEEKEELEKDLDTKITYMLSLSPEDLYDYYMEDDRKKKAEAYRHNYMAAFRYLAREESKKKKNKALFDKRLEELKEGKMIYSQKDIEEATKILETTEMNNDKVKDEDKIISLIEYIDSTLFRQMLYVETSLNQKVSKID